MALYFRNQSLSRPYGSPVIKDISPGGNLPMIFPNLDVVRPLAGMHKDWAPYLIRDWLRIGLGRCNLNQAVEEHGVLGVLTRTDGGDSVGGLIRGYRHREVASSVHDVSTPD